MQLAKLSCKITMPPMSSAYDQLLDATIRHLEDLQSRGTRHVAVSLETLKALAQPPPRILQVPLSQPSATLSPSSGERDGVRGVPTISRQPSAIQPPVAPRPTQMTSSPRPATASQPQAEAPALFSLPGDTPAPSAPPLDPTAKAAAFAALRERALACVKCPHLASSRKTVVFGVGNIDSPLMFVGEAPG